MADIVFAFDPAIDRPVPVSDDAPPAVAERVATAAAGAFMKAVETAARGDAAAFVLCGRVLDPLRASPAQAALVRDAIDALAAQGCRTILVADESAACNDLSRMLGEPASLGFVTPLAPVEFDVRGLAVEIVSVHGAAAASAAPTGLHRRIVVGSDAAAWRWGDGQAGDDGRGRGMLPGAGEPAAAAWAHPGAFGVWAGRFGGATPAGARHLPALQARSHHEASAGSCGTLDLFDREAAAERRGDGSFAVPRGDWRATWREVPTHRVAWRTVTVESSAGGDEELATAIWAALEGGPKRTRDVLEIVRCVVQCGTSVARRVRVAEISAETLARLRQLHDPQASGAWCREIVADPRESLVPLGHARSGGRPGTTTSFSSALADIVAAIEQEGRPEAADLAREAGWLALELVEST